MTTTGATSVRSFITENTVIARRGSLALRRFEPRAEAAGAKPVLLVPSIINRSYIFDLSEDRSFVRHLLERGLPVYIIDWGEPSRLDAQLGLADYARSLIRFSINATRRDSGAESVHLLGYCLGGTFSLIAAARGTPGIASVVALTTPVDLSQPGPMGKLTDPRLIDFEALSRGAPIIPGPALYTAFQSLDPTGTSAKLRGLISKRGDSDFVKRFIDLETWVTDSVAMTAKAAREIVEQLYRKNALALGQLRLDGEVIQLAQGRAPVLNLMARTDTICPAEASLPLKELWGGPVTNHVFPGGHLGVVVGSRAPDNMWRVTSDWLLEQPR